MTQRNVTHGTFCIERRFDAAPARVFKAFSDIKAKQQWFNGPPGWVRNHHELDFRVGGQEISDVGPPGGMHHIFQARYWDIVPNERIVFSYDMQMDRTRISVSLTTVELRPDGGGTRLCFTEQGVFFADSDGPDGREEGTKFLLDALAVSLTEAPADA
ncbi:SRPBCC family protein [Phenylobacterium montanum]|uniref:SRPBCC family protein n=1 Tax=Phenylobacterium montanum TaxID=2823693 RepID=A0A975FXR6_9CAUL|nr:SRPBCC family protein [Caulobacter sp. S6]QUD87169.1 SRPBCC family protein [Caulobacter sp. S6]